MQPLDAPPGPGSGPPRAALRQEPELALDLSLAHRVPARARRAVLVPTLRCSPPLRV